VLNQLFKAKLVDAASKRKYREFLDSEETVGRHEEGARRVLLIKEETRNGKKVGHCQSEERRDVPKDGPN